MKYMVNSNVLLTCVILLIASLHANAQTDESIITNSIYSNSSTDSTKKIYLDDIPNKLDKSDNIDQMPILSPDSTAAIKVYRPPERVIYNMPVIGKEDTTKFDSTEK